MPQGKKTRPSGDHGLDVSGASGAGLGAHCSGLGHGRILVWPVVVVVF